MKRCRECRRSPAGPKSTPYLQDFVKHATAKLLSDEVQGSATNLLLRAATYCPLAGATWSEREAWPTDFKFFQASPKRAVEAFSPLFRYRVVKAPSRFSAVGQEQDLGPTFPTTAKARLGRRLLALPSCLPFPVLVTKALQQICHYLQSTYIYLYFLSCLPLDLSSSLFLSTPSTLSLSIPSFAHSRGSFHCFLEYLAFFLGRVLRRGHYRHHFLSASPFGHFKQKNLLGGSQYVFVSDKANNESEDNPRT